MPKKIGAALNSKDNEEHAKTLMLPTTPHCQGGEERVEAVNEGCGVWVGGKRGGSVPTGVSIVFVFFFL